MVKKVLRAIYKLCVVCVCVHNGFLKGKTSHRPTDILLLTPDARIFNGEWQNDGGRMQINKWMKQRGFVFVCFMFILPSNLLVKIWTEEDTVVLMNTTTKSAFPRNRYVKLELFIYRMNVWSERCIQTTLTYSMTTTTTAAHNFPVNYLWWKAAMMKFPFVASLLLLLLFC